MPTRTPAATPLKIAIQLIDIEKEYVPLFEKRELLKGKIRKHGARQYATDKGTVTVSEPETRKFKGQILVLGPAIDKLNSAQIHTLIDRGVLKWEDSYTREAAAKVTINANL